MPRILCQSYFAARHSSFVVQLTSAGGSIFGSIPKYRDFLIVSSGANERTNLVVSQKFLQRRSWLLWRWSQPQTSCVIVSFSYPLTGHPRRVRDGQQRIHSRGNSAPSGILRSSMSWLLPKNPLHSVCVQVGRRGALCRDAGASPRTACAW